MPTIKYFGQIADITGKYEESISIDAGATVADLQAQLQMQYIGLKNTSYKIAINQAFATTETLVHEHDEVALLPPFAGG